MEMSVVCVFVILNIRCIDAEFVNSKSRLDYLENLMKHTLESLSSQQDDLTEMESKLSEQADSVHDLQNNVKSKRRSSVVIAFTSKVSKPFTNLTNNEAIIFDHAITPGWGYVPTTGQFTCPLSGLYEFAASIVSSGSGRNVEIEMVIDGNPLLTIHATGYDRDTGTQIVIIQCIEGQKVWVRHVTGMNSKATLAENSYFSGHLIHAD